MKNQCATLIQNSRILTNTQKRNYLRTLQSLPDDQIKRLFAILSKEQSAQNNINSAIVKKKSAVNKRCIQEAEALYKSEYKKAYATQELDEKTSAESILNQINANE